jgi:UDP-N-acetylglucosamine acyltransferase
MSPQDLLVKLTNKRMQTISTLSYIHPTAIIGEGVTISNFVSIEEDVIIGDGTWIAPNVVIMAGARIGKNCKIFSGAVISGPPQDLKYAGEPTTLEIGDNTVVRECCTLNRGTKATGKTVIGKNCLLMAYTHVAHDCIVGNECVLSNNATLAGHVELEDYVLFGGMVGVQQFLKVGAYSMLGGGTMHNKDVPPYVRIGHVPSCYIGVNTIGLRRRGFSDETIRHIQDIYQHLYVFNQNISKGMLAVQENIPDSVYKTQILNFVETSKGGVVRGFKI